MNNKEIIKRLDKIIIRPTMLKADMFASKELITLRSAAQILRKVESGELVEVVRCKDCIYHAEIPCPCDYDIDTPTADDWYCPCGIRLGGKELNKQ
jgi:hypothetical protein